MGQVWFRRRPPATTDLRHPLLIKQPMVEYKLTYQTFFHIAHGHLRVGPSRYLAHRTYTHSPLIYFQPTVFSTAYRTSLDITVVLLGHSAIAKVE